MNLREEFDILRGEPIQVLQGDPMEIPCVETSDSRRLCRNPLVSVQMITYNHEPYIREAIEGVVKQETDFDFELVIGEDCSTDRTREICLEYQKKHPDKIRVLWWHENLRKVNHPAGQNGTRTRAHCRGEFIALCEGDDYWTDPKKLQKQVAVMRQYPNVVFSFAGSGLKGPDGVVRAWKCNAYAPGVIEGRKFSLYNIFGADPTGERGTEGFVPTATCFMRTSIYKKMVQKYEVFKWRLSAGDTQLSVGMGLMGDVYYLQDQVSVYRYNPTGAMATNLARVCIDSNISRYFFALVSFGLDYKDIPFSLRYSYILYITRWLMANRGLKSKQFARQVISSWRLLSGVFGLRYIIGLLCMRCGLYNDVVRKITFSAVRRLPTRLSREVVNEYKKFK